MTTINRPHNYPNNYLECLKDSIVDLKLDKLSLFDDVHTIILNTKYKDNEQIQKLLSKDEFNNVEKDIFVLKQPKIIFSDFVPETSPIGPYVPTKKLDNKFITWFEEGDEAPSWVIYFGLAEKEDRMAAYVVRHLKTFTEELENQLFNEYKEKKQTQYIYNEATNWR